MQREIDTFIEGYRAQFIELSKEIWSHQETNYEEVKWATILSSYLANQSFKVETNVATIATAFTAQYGNGKPIIAILGE